MTGNHSIEPLLEQLYGSVLTPDGLHAFMGNLESRTDTDGGMPRPATSNDSDWPEARYRHAPATRPTHRHGASSDASGVTHLLRPHLHNARAIKQRLDHLETRLRTLLDVLERMVVGVALLDGHGRCLFANAPVQQLHAEHDGMQLVHGRLRACTTADQLRLQALINLSLSGPATFEARMLLRGARGQPALILTINAMRESMSTDAPDAVRAVVFAQPVVPRPDAGSTLLRELFGFTFAEARLALALLDHGDLGDACNSLGKSLATGRVQLRMLMEKTGCHRQNCLFRALSVALSAPGRPLTTGYTATSSG